jgi:hypothetical protein
MYRLIYKSRSKAPIDWSLVDAIIGSSDKNNPVQDITGVLLATRTHFLQVIEGSFESVNTLFDTIARDPRHDSLQLVSFASVERRAYGNWAMYGVGIFDLQKEIVSRLKREFGEENGEVRLPTDEWAVAAFIHDIRQVSG